MCAASGAEPAHPAGSRFWRRFLLIGGIVVFFAALNVAGIVWMREQLEPRPVAPRVATVHPTGESTTRPVISVTFTGPVIAADRRDRSAGNLIRLEPEAKGDAIWAGSSQLVYQLRADLPHAQTFKIIVSEEIGAEVGPRLEGPREFTFSTEPVKLLHAEQVGFTRDMEATIALRFNSDLTPEQIRPHLRVLDAEQKEVTYWFPSDYPEQLRSSQLQVRCRAAGEHLSVVFGPARGSVRVGLTDAGPEPPVPPQPLIVTALETQLPVYLTYDFRLSSVSSSAVFRGFPSVMVQFNNPVDPYQRVEADGVGRDARISEFFVVDPPVPFFATPRHSSVVLEGEFQPGASYKITVNRGLRGAGGRILGSRHIRDLKIPDRTPQLEFSSDGTFLSSQGSLSLQIETANSESVTIQPYRVHRNNLVHYLQIQWQNHFTRTLEPKTYHLSPTPNQFQELVVDLKDLTGPDPTGVWYLRAENSRNHSASKLVTVSDLGITAKISPDEIFVWTSSLRTAKPVSQAIVSLWTSTNQLIQEAVSDVDGIVRFTAPLSSADGTPYVITASREPDLSYLEIEGARLSRTDFDVGGRPYLGKGYEAFVFTERGVYRPGDDVHLRALVSGPPGTGGAPLPLEVEILRPDGKRFRCDTLTLGDSGAVEITVPIPPSAHTGRYEAKVLLPGGPGSGSSPAAAATGPGGRESRPIHELGATTFRVEEYFPNRLRTEVLLADGPEGQRFRPGGKVTFIVRSKYLHGMPAEGCAAEARWSLTARPFSHADWTAYSFGERVPQKVSIRHEAGSATLDAAGTARFEVEIPQVTTSSMVDLRFTAAVHDVSGRPVSADLTVPVDPSPVYIGVRHAGEEAPIVGQAARFECVGLEPGGRLSSLEAVELIVSKVRWTSVLKRNAGGYYGYESREEIREVSRGRVVLSSGRGAFECTLDEVGAYRLRLRDPGSSAACEMEVTARQPGASTWVAASMERPEHAELTPARSSYRPGETARILVRSPFAGTLFLTTETNRVETARILEMPRNTLEVEIPIPTDASTNFYVSASIVRPVEAEAEWAPHRAYGILSVPVDLSARRLYLTLSAPPEMRPGSRGSLRIVAAGEDGSPAPGAEVSLALVDTGILSLTGYRTPDPFGFFYSKRAHGVEIADTFASLLAEVPLEKERSRPAGDDDGAKDSISSEGRLSPVVARRVKPAVIWCGPLRTGDDGGVVADFELPQFTGEMRVFAVASAGGSRFGAAEQTMLVRGPFFFEIGMPRFLAPGDQVESAVQVFNRTEAAGKAVLSWTLEGLREGIAPAAPDLAFASHREPQEVEAGGSSRLTFFLSAEDRVGVAKASLSGSLGSETYAETIELPVRPPAPRMTRGSSGVASEGKDLELLPLIDAVAGTGSYRLTLSRFPAVEFEGALRYLIAYPHGCLEQTTSRVLPLVYLRDLIRVIGPDGSAKEDGSSAQPAPGGGGGLAGAGVENIDGFVQAGIARILDMQSLTGWMSTWTNGSNPWRWGTIYATHFLVEARSAGYVVPDVELDAALEYIRKDIVRSSSSVVGQDLALERAYGLYVLALAGKPELGTMDGLLGDAFQSLGAQEPGQAASSRFPPSARHLLAAAYLRVGKEDVARLLLVEKILPQPDAAQDTGGVLRSPVREAALLLAALLDVDPQSGLVPQLVDRLRDSRVDCRWGTTQENAFALLALGKYARFVSAQATDVKAEVRIGDAAPVRVHLGDDRVFSGATIASPIRVAVTGPGILHYSWMEDGVPRTVPIGAVDEGVKVRRRYIDRQGLPLDPRAVTAGEVIMVEISLESDRRLENLMVTDLLPAGLEVENPNLLGGVPAIAAATPSGDASQQRRDDTFPLVPENVSLRDDRVLMCFSYSFPGKRGVHRYVCRAVSRGDFDLPPVQAEALYDPRVRSLAGAGRFIVR